jgi:DNA polymerase
MIGRSRASLSRDELEEYASYCCNDTDSTHWLFNRLRPLFPKEEFVIMDQTLRMYLNPKFELDAHLLAEVLQEEQAKKAQLLASVQSIADKTKLMSNDKFADVLLALGVEPPRKISPTTGKLTWAFAKGDTGFKQMQEDFEDDPTVSTLLDARLGVKSTIGESRTARLLKIAQRRKLLRVPLGYYRAHTGRYGGMEKINLQNPPRIDKSRLRYALRAPPGHLVLAADLSQIEARIVAWLAGCQLLLNGFRNGEDVYSSFATNAYGEETIKGRSALDNSRRFVGKTCILGLGFGMGSEKLQGTLRKDDVKISAAEAGTLVGTYRNLYAEIPKLWTFLTNAGLGAIASGDKRSIGPCLTGKHMVLLPNGMPIYYHDLRKEPLTNEWVYAYGRETRQIWGGKLTENIVQALARILVMQNMITMREEMGLEMALQVHDELDYIVPERDAQHLGRQIEKIMSTPPAWALDLPVAVEVKFGHTFGDCK